MYCLCNIVSSELSHYLMLWWCCSQVLSRVQGVSLVEPWVQRTLLRNFDSCANDISHVQIYWVSRTSVALCCFAEWRYHVFLYYFCMAALEWLVADPSTFAQLPSGGQTYIYHLPFIEMAAKEIIFYHSNNANCIWYWSSYWLIMGGIHDTLIHITIENYPDRINLVMMIVCWWFCVTLTWNASEQDLRQPDKPPGLLHLNQSTQKLKNCAFRKLFHLFHLKNHKQFSTFCRSNCLTLADTHRSVWTKTIIIVVLTIMIITMTSTILDLGWPSQKRVSKDLITSRVWRPDTTFLLHRNTAWLLAN